MKKFLPVFAWLTCITMSVSGQIAGTIDETFKSGGFANTLPQCVALQGDGKLLVAGRFRTFNSTTCNGIVRLNPDFTVDNTFNSGGGIPYDEEITNIAVQTDGKIIIAGDFTSYDGILINDLARLNADGSLDATFNSGTGVNYEQIFDIETLPDGKIIIAGNFAEYNGISRQNIAKINSDGSVNSSFDPGSGESYNINDVAIQSDGKIVAVGRFTTYQGYASKNVMRIKPNGDFDSTFDVGEGADKEVYCVALQSNHKILIGGDFLNVDNISAERLARLNTNGSVDITFDTSPGADKRVLTVIQQSDGKILAGGDFESYKGVEVNHYVRLKANGTIDNSFKNESKTHQTNEPKVFTILVTPDGKIILHATALKIQDALRYQLIRLLPNGLHDDTYTTPPFGFYRGEEQYASLSNPTICLTHDNNIIAGVDYLTESYDTAYILNLVKIDPNGLLDTSFKAHVLGQGFSYVYSVAEQANYRILVGGYTVFFEPIQRFYPDGTYDYSFNPVEDYFHEVFKIIPLEDRKIWVGGVKDEGNPLARLNADGSIDPTNPVKPFSGVIYDFELDADDKLIIGGQGTTFQYDGIDVHGIFRINADGSYDETFNPGSGISGYGSAIDDIIIQPDGKYLVGGNFTTFDGIPVNHLVRLNHNGSVDATFTAPDEASIGGPIDEVELQPDGKILCSVQDFEESSSQITLERLYADGSIDVTFHDAIIYGPDYPFECCGGTRIEDIAIQPDGKILIIGMFSSYDHYTRGQIARLNNDLGCAIPTGLYADNITSIEAKLHWDAVPGAEKYQVWYRPTGSDTWMKKSASSNVKQLKELMPSTTYQYKIRTDCGDSTSAFSSVETFTTLPMRLGEMNDEFSVKIYPNPNSGTFTIAFQNLKSDGIIQISEISGKLIYEDKFSADNDFKSITLNHFTGLALVKVITNKTIFSQGIVVQ